MNKDKLRDKLCERLVVEAGGVRVYDAVLAKVGEERLRRQLRELRDEEQRHANVLGDLIEEMGYDGSDLSPAARLLCNESAAFLDLVRSATTDGQALELLLHVELADNDAWQPLIDLASRLGRSDLARQFAHYLQEGQEHLHILRELLAARSREEGEMEGPRAHP